MDDPFHRLRRNMRLLGMMRQIPRRLLPQKIKSLIRNRLLPVASKTAEARRNREQAKIDEGKGCAAGNLHFWTVLPNREWADVQARLFALDQTGQDGLIEDFLRQGLLVGQIAPMLPLLARSGLSRPALTGILRSADFGPDSDMTRRMVQSILFSVNLSATVLYLLEPDEAEPVLVQITRIYPTLPATYHAAMDSFSLVPGMRPSSLRGTVPFSPTRGPARHRLIVVDALKDPQRISLLFGGAEKVTVFSPSDLYGKLTFGDMPLHHRPQEIVVAHPRSRITRFSAKYHALHTETWQIAEEMVAELERDGEGFLREAAPYMALHLADKLFFAALSTAAFEDFVTAEDFDQIVIASAGHIRQEQFFKGLATGIDLSSDPRIELTCLSPTAALRASFGKDVGHALWPKGMDGSQAPTVDALTRPLSEILEETARSASPAARKMRSFPAMGGRLAALRGDEEALSEAKPAARVMYVTTQVGAYNASSTQYLDILFRHFNTLTAFVGTNTTAYFRALPEGTLPPASGTVQLLNTGTTTDHARLGDYLKTFTAKTRARLTREGRGRLTAHVLDLKADEIAGSTLKSGFHHWITLLNWFKRLEERGAMPELMVLSPMRPALVGMAAAAARRHGIPSLALESHGLNRSYCRYSKIATDRYGVISSFFRDDAAHGFGIPADRVDVIGSPRLRAPAEYDGTARRAAARAAIMAANPVAFANDQTVIAFFTQPSNWEQISAVWSIILGAIKDMPRVRILLQPHPEEGPARLTGYQAMAEGMGLTDRIDTVKAGAIEVIEACDLVLSCYSATVVEAALYRKPVFCVKDGPGDYPLNQNEVVGAPMFRDVDSLRQEIAAFIAAPQQFQARAQLFLEREPQMISGPEARLVEVVEAMLARPAAATIRPAEDLPPRLFIEGPHQVFDV